MFFVPQATPCSKHALVGKTIGVAEGGMVKLLPLVSNGGHKLLKQGRQTQKPPTNGFWVGGMLPTQQGLMRFGPPMHSSKGVDAFEEHDRTAEAA